MIEQQMSEFNDAHMTQMAAVAIDVNKPNVPKLSPEMQKDIKKQMLNMFFGLTMSNWTRGKTLGAAWHDATQQMGAFLASKSATNPAVAYMATEFAKHRATVARQSMTHPNRDLTLSLPPEMLDKIQAKAAAAVNAGKDNLKNIFEEQAKAQSQSAPSAAKNPYADAIKKVQLLQMQQQQQMMMQQHQYGQRSY